MNKLNSSAFGYSAGLVSAAVMLVLGILGNFGVYTGAVEQMQGWHLLFSLSIGGIIGGMIEAAIVSFVIAYAFAGVYNKFNK